MKLVDENAFVTAQLCICTVLASSVIVRCMMVQFIVYRLIDGLKALLIIMCLVDALCFIVLFFA